jgi:hypothetical protein
MTYRYASLVILSCLALLVGGAASLHAQDELPYTLDQLVRLVESGAFTDDQLLELVQESCRGFRMDEDATQELQQAGASGSLVRSLLREVCERLTTVVVWPAELEVVAGSSGILRARALLDPDSAQIPNVVFEWTSEDTTVADVTGGVVVGKTAGETRITARTEDGDEGTALVRVVTAAAEAGTPADSVAGAAGKSGGTAAALGIIPGGGEFYVGNTTKGAIVLAGAAAALAAGFLLTSEDTLSAIRVPTAPPGCVGASCAYPVRTTAEIEETSYVVIGAAVAGAFWLYGLIDGIRTANKSGETRAAGQQRNGQGLSLQIAPADGIRVGRNGDVELTFVRIRS